MDDLIVQRGQLLQQIKNSDVYNATQLSEKISCLEVQISDVISDQKYQSLKADLTLFRENHNVNGVLWKMKSKVAPKRQKTQVTAKLDLSGKLVTAPEQLKSVYLEHLVQRLRHRPMRPEYQELRELKELLCQQRLDLVKTKEYMILLLF